MQSKQQKCCQWVVPFFFKKYPLANCRNPYASAELFDGGRKICSLLVEPIRPPLHQFPALGQVLCSVVRSPDFIDFFMGKLALNHIMRERRFFVQHGRRQCANSVCSHPAAITPVDTGQKNVFSDNGLPRASGDSSTSSDPPVSKCNCFSTACA